MGVGGHLVAGDDDEQQRHLPQLGGEVREQQQRRLVGPVEVVEQDGDRPRAAIAVNARRSASMSVASPASCGGSPSSGSRGARCAASGPQAGGRSGRSRRHARSTCATGLYGSATADRAAPAYVTMPPDRSAWTASRVLPMPASPVTITHRPTPARTDATASANAASSRSRAISRRWPGMARV